MKAVSQEALEILDNALTRITPMSFPITFHSLTKLRNAIEAELKDQQPDSDFSHYVKKVVAPAPDQSEKDRIFEAALAYGAGLAASSMVIKLPEYDAQLSADFANALYDKIYR